MQQARFPSGIQPKGSPGANNVIDPCFQHRWEREVVHRRGKHDRIGAGQFGNQLLGLAQHRTLCCIAQRVGHQTRLNERSIGVWQGFKCKIAFDHLPSRAVFL